METDLIDKRNKQPLAGQTTESASKPKARPKKPAPEYIDRTLGCRHELKYLISEAKAVAISEFIRPFMPVDRYSKLQPHGYYPIVSLYLDSDDLLLCKESLEGKQNRFKLRIRSYSDDQQYPTFFEIKRRISNVIMKSRAPVRHQDVAMLLQGLCLPHQDFRTNREALDQFQLYVSSIMAKPAVLIRYMRKAYESDSENRVRITFDRELCYRVENEPRITLDGSGWQRNHLTTTGVILEIKFTACYPMWLSRLVTTFDLKSRSISKFATSLQQASMLGFCGPQRGG
jgi:hypothetical protein